MNNQPTDSQQEPDYINPQENLPYLGPWWFALMLFLYLLKRLFPAETFSLFWYFQLYVIVLFSIVTLFVIYKRWQLKRLNINEPKKIITKESKK